MHKQHETCSEVFITPSTIACTFTCINTPNKQIAPLYCTPSAFTHPHTLHTRTLSRAGLSRSSSALTNCDRLRAPNEMTRRRLFSKWVLDTSSVFVEVEVCVCVCYTRDGLGGVDVVVF